jgi:hypothetical protein
MEVVWRERKQVASKHLLRLSAALAAIHTYHGQLLALLMSTVNIHEEEAMTVLQQAEHILREVKRLNTAVEGFLQATLHTQCALMEEGYMWTEEDKEFGCETRVLADRLAAVLREASAVQDLLRKLQTATVGVLSEVSIQST